MVGVLCRIIGLGKHCSKPRSDCFSCVVSDVGSVTVTIHAAKDFMNITEQYILVYIRKHISSIVFK